MTIALPFLTYSARPIFCHGSYFTIVQTEAWLNNAHALHLVTLMRHSWFLIKWPQPPSFWFLDIFTSLVARHFNPRFLFSLLADFQFWYVLVISTTLSFPSFSYQSLIGFYGGHTGGRRWYAVTLLPSLFRFVSLQMWSLVGWDLFLFIYSWRLWDVRLFAVLMPDTCNCESGQSTLML